MKTNIIIIYSALVILSSVISCEKAKEKAVINNFDNYLNNSTWLIKNEKLIGSETDEKQFILTKKNDTAVIWNFSAVEFTDKNKFRSYNSWKCGNDCFTAIDGKYQLVEASKIEFQIENIAHTGTCEAPVEHFAKPKIITLNVARFGDSLVLNKN